MSTPELPPTPRQIADCMPALFWQLLTAAMLLGYHRRGSDNKLLVSHFFISVSRGLRRPEMTRAKRYFVALHRNIKSTAPKQLLLLEYALNEKAPKPKVHCNSLKKIQNLNISQ